MFDIKSIQKANIQKLSNTKTELSTPNNTLQIQTESNNQCGPYAQI